MCVNFRNTKKPHVRIKKQRVQLQQLRVSKNISAMSLNRIQYSQSKWKGWDEDNLYYFSRTTKLTQTSEESVKSTCPKHWETMLCHKVTPFRSGALQTWLFCHRNIMQSSKRFWLQFLPSLLYHFFHTWQMGIGKMCSTLLLGL